MTKSKKKVSKAIMNINEGWDARGYDRRLHYFVRNRSVCSHLIRYHPPYFDAGFIPEPEDVEINDYCDACLKLLKSRYRQMGLKRFFK